MFLHHFQFFFWSLCMLCGNFRPQPRCALVIEALRCSRDWTVCAKLIAEDVKLCLNITVWWTLQVEPFTVLFFLDSMFLMAVIWPGRQSPKMSARLPGVTMGTMWSFRLIMEKIVPALSVFQLPPQPSDFPSPSSSSSSRNSGSFRGFGNSFGQRFYLFFFWITLC